jgi:hypothetical protein
LFVLTVKDIYYICKPTNTKRSRLATSSSHGDLAQLAERLICKIISDLQEVGSSNLPISIPSSSSLPCWSNNHHFDPRSDDAAAQVCKVRAGEFCSRLNLSSSLSKKYERSSNGGLCAEIVLTPPLQHSQGALFGAFIGDGWVSQNWKSGRLCVNQNLVLLRRDAGLLASGV